MSLPPQTEVRRLVTNCDQIEHGHTLTPVNSALTPITAAAATNTWPAEPGPTTTPRRAKPRPTTPRPPSARPPVGPASAGRFTQPTAAATNTWPAKPGPTTTTRRDNPRAEILMLNGQVSEIRYTPVTGRAPLEATELRYFEEIVSAKAHDIVTKWIDFFVLHKTIKPERITKRLK